MQTALHVQELVDRPAECILARAVIDRAVGDFLMRVPIRLRKKDTQARVLHPYRVALARRRVEAGRFLLKRHDSVAHLWFSLADFSLDAWHRRDAHFQRRLARSERVLALLEARAQQAASHRSRDARTHGLMRLIPRHA